MMNQTPAAERVHIAFFGCRNAGKSSLVNALTGQSLSVVSPQAGTTTDPVYKTMELLPLGPVVIIDTPGADDEGSLGDLRVEKTQEVLRRTDLAVLVVDGTVGLRAADRRLLAEFSTRGIPYLLVANKSDLAGQPEDSGQDSGASAGHLANAGSGQASGTSSGMPGASADPPENAASGKASDSFAGLPENAVSVSAKTREGIEKLKEQIAALLPSAAGRTGPRLVADLLEPGDLIVLVVPIDEAAPKGRLILPQQQVIRDALEAGAIPVVCRDTELAIVLGRTVEPQTEPQIAEDSSASGALRRPPALVVTDSQAFRQVAKIVPESIPLTSFSILMARYKGFLNTSLAGIQALADLRDGDCVLIAEGCTHHRQCNDIGTVKIPRWLHEYTDADFRIETVSGREFPEDLSNFRLVIHCGGCMLNEREVMSRMRIAANQGVPFLNYGVLIAEMNGILSRSIRPLAL